MLQRLFQRLLGIDPGPWTEGGGWRVEWLALPRRDWALLLAAGVAVAVWGVMYLYRREGRNLSVPVRVMLGTLRLVVLAGVLAMLLEPVIVFTKEEWVPSNLLVLLDESESMDLRDAYPDEARATPVAE